MGVRQNFVNLQIDYIDVVLMPAVTRASMADSEFSRNVELNKLLIQTTLGFCVTFHIAFIQKELGTERWNTLKRVDSSERSSIDINWEIFDILKYVRDCFSHSPDGNIFPRSQNNTIRFLDYLPRHPELKIEVIEDKLHLNSSTIQQSFNFFENFILKANI